MNNVKELDFNFYCRWLSIVFNQSDRNRSGALNFDECCQALSQLNLKVDRTEARRLFTVSVFQVITPYT